jgi:hypothetical protein
VGRVEGYVELAGLEHAEDRRDRRSSLLEKEPDRLGSLTAPIEDRGGDPVRAIVELGVGQRFAGLDRDPVGEAVDLTLEPVRDRLLDLLGAELLEYPSRDDADWGHWPAQRSPRRSSSTSLRRRPRRWSAAS